MIDKKGYLWVAHSLGISRYDGISFTNFSNPEQSAVGMTGLLEDDYGHIWFHNFNGQVFYIKDDKMVYLKEYDFRNSANYPAMALCGEELVITSLKGLFVCNTKTLQCKAVEPKGKSIYNGTTALCVIDDQVVANSVNFWFIYSAKNGLNRIPPANIDSSLKYLKEAKLYAHHFGDTILVGDDPAGLLYGLRISNNVIVKTFEQRIDTYINTICTLSTNLWVNTNRNSFQLLGKDTLNIGNLSSRVVDKNGNEWLGSLTDGLMVFYKMKEWQPLTTKNIGPGDYVKYMLNTGSNFLYISQYGRILNKIPGKDIFEDIATLPVASGRIEGLQAADYNHSFLETSKRLYLLDIAFKRIIAVDTNSVKSVFVSKDRIFKALSTGVQVDTLNTTDLKQVGNHSARFVFNDSALAEFRGIKHLRMPLRCRAMLYDSLTNSLLISFTDGLHRFKNSKLEPLLFRGKPLYVSSLVNCNNKIYAATFNNGLFIIVEILPSGLIRTQTCRLMR